MTKVIVRPETTTHVLDFMFHMIKDKEEAKNVADLIGDKQIFQVARGVDPDTFQPILYFAIPEDNKPFNAWLKYGSTMELLVKSDDTV